MDLTTISGDVTVGLALVIPAAVGLWLVAAGRDLSNAVVTRLAVAATTVTLLVVVLAVAMDAEVDRAWIPALGVRWHLGLDGISTPLVLLTAVIAVLATAHTGRQQPTGGAPSTMQGALLLVEFGALGTFLARDAVLFFVAFEIVLVPMWVLITRFGDPKRAAARADAGARFILYTGFGSTLMLVGILALVVSAGTSDLDALVLAGPSLDRSTQVIVAILLVTGLAVKVPVFPLHTWLPPAHTIAPTAGSVMLAAVLLKMGTYGLVRLPVASVPTGFAAVAPVLAVLGAVGIIWGGLVCLVERDLKRLIAYSSVAHMGFVCLGLASGTETGLQAALFGNIAHGIVSALLFFTVGGLKERWGGSADLEVRRPALREVTPRLGFVLIVGLAGTLGLPGLASFWGEVLSAYAAWSPDPDRPVGVLRATAVVAVVGTVLAAAYALRVASRVWFGDAVPAAIDAVPATVAGAAAASSDTGATGAAGASGAVSGAADPSGRAAATRTTQAAGRVALDPERTDTSGVEQFVLAVLVVATIGLGVLPGPLLAMTSDAVATLVGGR